MKIEINSLADLVEVAWLGVLVIAAGASGIAIIVGIYCMVMKLVFGLQY